MDVHDILRIMPKSWKQGTKWPCIWLERAIKSWVVNLCMRHSTECMERCFEQVLVFDPTKTLRCRCCSDICIYIYILYTLYIYIMWFAYRSCLFFLPLFFHSSCHYCGRPLFVSFHSSSSNKSCCKLQVKAMLWICVTHTMHGTIVYIPIHLPWKWTIHVGKYTVRPMDGSVRSRHTVLLEHLATQQLRVEALLQRDRGEVRSQEDFSEVTWDCTHCFVIFLFFVLIGKYISDCQWSEKNNTFKDNMWVLRPPWCPYFHEFLTWPETSNLRHWGWRVIRDRFRAGTSDIF